LRLVVGSTNGANSEGNVNPAPKLTTRFEPKASAARVTSAWKIAVRKLASMVEKSTGNCTKGALGEGLGGGGGLGVGGGGGDLGEVSIETEAVALPPVSSLPNSSVSKDIPLELEAEAVLLAEVEAKVKD